MGILKWINSLFRKKPVDFPKTGAWMLNSDYSPNVRNLERCREFINLKNTRHSRRWHREGDPLKHTLLVAKALHAYLSLDTILSIREKRNLMLAALCHDLGKAVTTYYDNDEKDWKCKDHGAAGELITRNLLYDEEIHDREEICWLVRHHMTLHHILEKPVDKQEAILKKLSKGSSTVMKLILLAKCDALGSKSRLQSVREKEDAYTKITELATRLGVMTGPNESDLQERDPYTAYLLIGIPGSGKDTYINTNSEMKYLPVICRDDIREELKDGKVAGRKLLLSKQGEEAVTKVVNDRIKIVSEKNESFIINQTNLKKKRRDSLVSEIREYGNPRIVYIYVEGPSLEECIRRRQGQIQEGVIRDMWNSLEMPDGSECDSMRIIKT